MPVQFPDWVCFLSAQRQILSIKGLSRSPIGTWLVGRLRRFLPSNKGFARTALAPFLKEHSQAPGLGSGPRLQHGEWAAPSLDWLEHCKGLDQSPERAITLPEFPHLIGSTSGGVANPLPVPRIGLWP